MISVEWDDRRCKETEPIGGAGQSSLGEDSGRELMIMRGRQVGTVSAQAHWTPWTGLETRLQAFGVVQWPRGILMDIPPNFRMQK